MCTSCSKLFDIAAEPLMFDDLSLLSLHPLSPALILFSIRFLPLIVRDVIVFSSSNNMAVVRLLAYKDLLYTLYSWII